jgi:hypothetical protein
MRKKFIGFTSLLILLSMMIAPLTTSLASTGTTGSVRATDSVSSRVLNIAESETGLYIIQLTDPAVPSYMGGIPGLAPTSPQVTGERRLDASSAAVQAYAAYLHDKQDTLIADMEQTLGRSVEVVFRYDGAMNGLAVAMSHEEALQVSQLDGIKAIFGDTEREIETDVGPWFLGATSIWEGNTGSGVATRGEGIIVGVIDTGINFEHLSFAETDGDGYTHTNPYGSGVFHGWCASNPGCNDKLIGAYGLNPVGGNPADDNGHGSHTGSTAAGNLHEAVFDVGSETYNLTIAGMAPRANIVAYKVCTPSCPGSASIQAVNHAIMDDQVDVLNYSISGVDNPWLDSVDLAFLEGFNAGIFISASAGNAGPGPGTVAKTGPWNASVAASTHNRVIAHTVDVTGPTTPPELQDMAAVPGENTLITDDITGEVRFNPDNVRGCVAHPPGFFADAIALIERGDCTFAIKVDNAVAAGAINVIVYNHVGGPPITMGGLTGIPETVFIDNVNGADLRDYVIANPGATVIINAATSLLYNDNWQNVMAGFSSRGPSQFEMLAPTFTAPGVNILAAGAFGDTHYYFNQGTSMSSPHAAGAGALMMALNPSWSPAEVRSALAMTAVPELVKEDGITPADPFDLGSGLLNLTAAGYIGLVMDETYDNFVDANPAIGGDPKTLNLPSMVDYHCMGECSWTRVLSSTLDYAVIWTTSFTSPDGVTATVLPDVFELGPFESQTITITADVTGAPIGEYSFGDLLFTPNLADPATSHLPMVVVAEEVVTEPVITVDPASLSSSQPVDQVVTETLTIGNIGGTDLVWEVVEDAPLLATGTPLGVTTPIQIGDTTTTVTIGDLSLARSAEANTGLTVFPTRLATPQDLVTITHSNSQAILAGNSVACSSDNGITTTSNQYLRTFTLEDFGIFGDFDITEVEFGIENLSGAAQTLTVNLYTLEGDFIYANLTLIGTADIALDPQSLTIAIVPVNGTAPAGSTLVVEVEAPDMTGISGFWIGSNAEGETAPSYIASTPCGINNPLPFGSIGFPNVHVVMNVTGEAQPVSCDAPGGTSWVGVDPLSGMVIPGGSQEVSVTFDSTGLSGGEYTANLCLGSNDPVTPLVVVPLTLDVLEIPVIQVDPTSLDFVVPVDNQAADTLTIGNTGISDLVWDIFEDASPASILANWMDDFDSYATGSQLHGQGGWKGWDNNPAAGALTSDTQARSIPNSAAIVGASDLVQEYSGYTSGTWVYTAWQYVPDDFAGTSYFIMLNTYNDGGPYNWSIQVNFDSTSNLVTNDGISGGTLPLIKGQWVELRVEIDLNADTQSFYYDNQLLYIGTWTGEVSGGGVLNIGAVDLFANGASLVYYDDMSLLAPIATCDVPEDISWLSLAPTGGVTPPGMSDDVTVSVDALGLTVGESYAATLCVISNDPVTPLVEVPVSLEVVDIVYGIELTPAEDAMSGAPGGTVEYTLTLTNTGNVADTFDLTFEGNNWDVVLQPDEISLGAGSSALVSVFVTIPADASDGESDMVTVTATSLTDETATDSSELTTTSMLAGEFGVELTPVVDALSGAPGVRVEYSLTLVNTGSVTDTFNLTFTDNTWNVHLPETSITAGAGESTTVIVHVDVPLDAMDGASDMVTVTATSITDVTATDSSVLTTTASWNKTFIPFISR